MYNSIIGFIKTVILFIRNKVKFDKNAVNKMFHMFDGKLFTIFRQVIIKMPSDPERFEYKIINKEEDPLEFTKVSCE